MAVVSQVASVRLTGRPTAQVGPREWAFEPDKRYQLLSYLAYHGEWLGRERLAFLFWPDTDTAGSRQNLRGLLQRLRTLPFDPGVETTQQALRWSPLSDVAEFRAAVERDDLDGAIDAYRGPLLAELEGEEPGEFGDWLQIERERLHGEWRAVALRRLQECRADEPQSAERLLRRLLGEDEFDEEALTAYLGTMRRLGQVAAARTQYRQFVKRLESELGLEPTAATVAAFEALDETVPTASVVDSGPETAAPAPAPPRGEVVRLPRPSSSFVGRQHERSEIEERLLNDDCRLLTIHGPGGIGKTRLALAVAHDIEDQFADGAVFVPLAAVAATDDVPLAVARALGLKSPPGGATDFLKRALERYELLLVLDNCEHLPGVAELLTTLLDDAPGVRVLATSRSRLALSAEWQYPLQGLAFPTAAGSLEELLEFPATELFLARARRVRPSFEVGAEELGDLLRLSQYLEGMPLAIELTAAWTRSLPLTEIVSELGRNLDLLSSSAVDASPRHQSIHATFEQSWAILTEPERTALRRLSVFQEAVRGEAASFVAGASRQLVTALVDKSLLRLTAAGRYHQHPLWLAFTRVKLAEDVDEQDENIKRHATYYLRFLRERTDRARGLQPADALSEIDAELADILAAAESARERGNDEQLVAFMTLLAIDTGYLLARGFGPRRLSLLEAAAVAAERMGDLEAVHPLRGRLADAYGTHQSERRRSLDEYGRAAKLAERSGNRARQAVYLSMSGLMALHLGSPGSDAQLDDALAIAEEADDELSLAMVLEHRAYSLLVKGEYVDSRDLYRRTLDIVTGLQESGSGDPFELRRLRFFCLLNQGEAELQSGEQQRAFEARDEALALAERSGNSIWAAYACQELGEMYERVGKRSLAAEHLQRSLSIYRENHVTAHADRLISFMEDHGYDQFSSSAVEAR